ncbi:MAG: hypothetical protein HY875_11970 [Chloroflexi bacterium]|nr:hypothetical protein [Chloroflexota bacterium]
MPPTPPAQLPIPANFPVAWDRPGDEQLFWIQDAMHLPHPLTPLDATLVQAAFSEGASRAIGRMSMPISGLRTGVFNGFSYIAPVPVMGTPGEMAARMEEMIRITMELGATVLRDWRETFEPQVTAECEAVLGFNYAGASTREVAAFVAGFYDRLVKLWDIHMRVNIPPMNAVFGMEEFLGAVVGPDSVQQSRLMLQGFDNKSVEMGKALWDLSRWVRANAGLADAVNVASVLEGKVQLSGHPQAADFLSRWQAFLDAYGWRSNRFLEVGYPSWRDDQATPFTQFKGFLAKPDSEDPYAAHRAQAAERDQLVAEMEARVPAPAVPQFRHMLELAQQYIPIAEDHNFSIDQKSTMVLRHGIQQLGARLAADGVLADAGDVFYLRFEEIQALASGAATGDLRGPVKERRAAHLRQAQIKPPPVMGTPPPADMPPDPLVSKFFGLAIDASWHGRTLKGLACSAGIVTGPAKVLLSLDDAWKLEPGDIMVCRTTMPAWTPLFGIAAAVVTDAGGPLSHCAIVAREYRIPCVAGTQVATHEITDGMRLRVDGAAGTVELLDGRTPA